MADKKDPTNDHEGKPRRAEGCGDAERLLEQAERALSRSTRNRRPAPLRIWPRFNTKSSSASPPPVKTPRSTCSATSNST